MTLQISSITCIAAEPGRFRALFEALGAGVREVGTELVADVGNATIVYRAGEEPSGLGGIELTGESPVEPRELRASGVEVSVTRGARRGDRVGEPIRLDHVAIGVADLPDAESTWADITGVDPVRMGVHPASGGAFTATRFELGPQMIELVSPVPGVDSAIARRIATHGDSPVTVALPVRDLDAVTARLRTVGIHVLPGEPHTMVHPRDTGGVLVQLTPRIQH